jgi:5-formyltetrahydrofolate cyclo-ligase
MNKSELRQEIRKRKGEFTQQQLDELSIGIVDSILSHPKVIEAHTIFLYYSLPGEVNTHLLVDILHDMGKRILLPVVIDSMNMEIREYCGTDSMKPGNMNIMEPVGKAYDEYEKIELALVPGMSFDSAGHRLGRGKGYYDRILAKMKNTYKIGVCFNFQKVKNVPVFPNDILMDEIIY